MKKNFILTLLFLIFLSTSSDTQRKLIKQNNFDIECNVYLKLLKNFDNTKEYFWFKSSEVHSSIGTSGGFVLHKDFKKYYRSNQLAQSGNFHYGLKDGIWQEWHNNGKIRSIIHWKNGVKHGNYQTFDTKGKKLISGYFRNNDSTKAWINHTLKDTTYFKKGKASNEKSKSLFQRVFKKRDSLEKQTLKKEKSSWLKRLFKKTPPLITF
jgi:antitoxin component YwqK of YwqJK toxin-antitoxin module